MDEPDFFFNSEDFMKPIVRLVSLLTLVTLFVTLTPFRKAAADTPALWTHKPSHDIQWYTLTNLGALLVGTKAGLYQLDSETGRELWRRDDLSGIEVQEVREVAGTPLLLVADTSGRFQQKTKLFALDIVTGKTAWETDRLPGATVAFAPNYEKDMAIFLTAASNAMTKDKLDVTALRLTSGEFLWHTEYQEKVELYAAERNGKQTGKYDLSGAQPPIFDADSVYFTYAGLHRFSLADGKPVWKVVYDVTEGKIKQGNAQAVVDGDVVYTSAKGQLRAIDRATGAVRWTSKDFGGAIAEMQVRGDVIYGRLGGTFYDFGKREFVQRKPHGVVAVDKKSGSQIWFYDGAKNSLTNMAIIPAQNLILLADEKSLIGLDMQSTGKAKEVFRQKLEFKYKLGAMGTAAKVAKFGFGGLSAIGSKGADTTDEPVTITLEENGTAVVRGAQHLLAFDPKSRQIVWSSQYAAPGMSGWKVFVLTALTVAAATLSQANESNAVSRGDYWQARRANDQFISLMSAYEREVTKRYTATKQSGAYTYVLTDIKDDKDKGVGIIGVNMLTGQGERQIMFKDKDPDYRVDEGAGRVFNLRNPKELSAFAIR